MWYPRFDTPYNEFLSPRITHALGKTIINHAGLAVMKPGIYQAYFGDTFTTSLLIRSRLQTQAKHSPSDIPSQVVTFSAPVGGRKRKR